MAPSPTARSGHSRKETSSSDGSDDLDDFSQGINRTMTLPDEMRRKYVGAFTPAEPRFQEIHDTWPSIRHRIHQILESSPDTKHKVTSLGLFRLGFDRYRDQNPLTVLITLDSSALEWQHVRVHTQDYLDTLDLGLVVHMEHNEFHECFEPLCSKGKTSKKHWEEAAEYNINYRKEYKDVVNMGDDIGPVCHVEDTDGKLLNPGIGTIGCWVEVKYENEWRTMALTTWHVVRPMFEGFVPNMRPQENSICWGFDKTGIKIGGASRHRGDLSTESPARQKHNAIVSMFEPLFEASNHSKATCRKRAEILDKKQNFFAEGRNRFGDVWLASGLNRVKQRVQEDGNTIRSSLDWCLIEPHSQHRIGKNKMPPEEEWSYYNFIPSDEPHTGECLKQPPRSFHERMKGLEEDFKVYKSGMMSKCTMGMYNFERGDLGDTQEHCFVVCGTQPSEFAKKGNSGEIVFDKKGAAIGMVIGRLVPQQCEAGAGICYVTPIEDIFEDIIAMGDGGITEVRIMEE